MPICTSRRARPIAPSTAAKAVRVAGSEPSAQARALLAATRIVMRQPKSEARNSLAEKDADDLAALPAAFSREKIEAHGLLNGYYRGDDIDAGIIKHSTRIMELNKQLTSEQRAPLARTLVAAYVNLAEALAGQERTPEALEVLRRAPSELSGVSGVEATVKPTLDRYLLVGTPGAAISAPRWLNATPPGSRIEMPGQVTWREFTAHWCGPCRESYPGVVRLHQRFGAKGFRVVMSDAPVRPLRERAERSGGTGAGSDSRLFPEARHHVSGGGRGLHPAELRGNGP